MSKADEFIEIVRSEEGIGDAVLITLDGNIMTKPANSETTAIVPMMAYLALSMIEMKKMIGFTSPSYITVNLKSEQRIVLIIGRNAHLVIELNYGLSPDSLITKLSGPLKNAVF